METVLDSQSLKDCCHYTEALHSDFLKSGVVSIAFLKGIIESDNSTKKAIFLKHCLKNGII